MTRTAAEQGALNLLKNCADLRAGQTLLILTEEATAGYYDPALAKVIARVADAMGLVVVQRCLPFRGDVLAPDADILNLMAGVDRTLFLARIGDQLRFSPDLKHTGAVVGYVMDDAMLGSGFGRAHHGAFVALKDCLNAAIAGAGRVHVTCPLGTNFEGSGLETGGAGAEVTVSRFPMSVFSPVAATGFRGRVAQAGFLTGTGAHYYQPYTQPLDDVLFLEFEGTELLGFDRSDRDVSSARVHYDRTAATLGVSPNFVHSWHAGIHPGCGYAQPSGVDPGRWAGVAFGNPRVLHFHTCGEVAPGEISVNVIDPTIRLDGVAVWDNGRLFPERVPGGADILAEFPCAAALFAGPCREIGLTAQGRLSAHAETRMAAE